MGNAPRPSSNARRLISKFNSAGLAFPAHPHVCQPRIGPQSFRGNNSKLLELFPTLFTNLFTFGFIQLDPVHHHHLSDASTKDGALENKRLSLRHKQSHRGAGPKDERLFGVGAWPAMRVAMRD